MRHRRRKKVLGRTRGPRKALVRVLLLHLIKEKKLTTSKPKAKIVRAEVEKLITLAKGNDLHARRLILKKLGSSFEAQKAASILLGDLQKKYMDRPGGFVRTAKLPARKGDASEEVFIEFV